MPETEGQGQKEQKAGKRAKLFSLLELLSDISAPSSGAFQLGLGLGLTR